jgi:hypothetical protein
MFELYEKWQGLIPVCLGLYITLKAWGIIPRNPKETQKAEQMLHNYWHVMRVFGPFLIAFGLLYLLHIL